MARKQLAGKVVAITGGARGIGAAIAAAMRREGAKVAIGDLDADLVAETAAGIGPDVVALRLDVTDHTGFTAFLDEVERRLGPIDVLVNNAGIMPVGLLEDESPETTARQLAINLHAVIHGTREAVRRMRPRDAGHIVNIASTAGKAGLPGVATYCATKHGVVGLSEAVRYELRGTGVDVSCVMPAIVRTELTSGVGDARFVKTVTPELVADAVVRAVRAGKFDVFVPRVVDGLNRVVRLLPRGLGEWIVRSIGADRIMIEAADSADRAAYESRAAASAPAADAEARHTAGSVPTKEVP
ncbi:MAG: SDR family NAD(P)-dependent oxidoreductase [Micromonosporaceae bacterium]|nr:SDR family NAD(P)-dependent oxidoreductase [Micromonosporaceae bacterium]